SVQRRSVLFHCFNRAPVNYPIFSRQLHSVNVAARQLRRLRFGFTGCFSKIVEMQPVTFPADVVGNAVIRAGGFSITINFHDRRAAFYNDWESDSFLFHRLILRLSTQILSEKCPTFASKIFYLRQFTYDKMLATLTGFEPVLPP